MKKVVIDKLSNTTRRRRRIAFITRRNTSALLIGAPESVGLGQSVDVSADRHRVCRIVRRSISLTRQGTVPPMTVFSTSVNCMEVSIDATIIVTDNHIVHCSC